MNTTTKLALVGCCLTLAPGVTQAATATENWETLCSSCHGTDGKAQNKMGKKLKIRDFSSAKVQAKLKDEDMVKAMTEGIKDHDKELMKSFREKLTPEDIAALVTFIRKLKE